MRHIPLARMRAINNLGVPTQGYTLTFYESGSSTVKKDTYTSEAKSGANLNPLTSDSEGWFGAVILDGGAYNVVYKDADGNTIWAEDPVTDIDTIVNALISAASSDHSEKVQQGDWTSAVATGTGDAIVLTLSPAPASYTDGMRVQCRGFTGANTVTNPTINVNTLGTKTIKKGNAEALLAGDIIGTDHYIDLIYNSNDDSFILQNPAFQKRYGTLAAGGTADALTVTNTGVPLADGREIYVFPTAANTGAATLDYNGGGAVAIEDRFGEALVADDIKGTSHILHLVYYSTDSKWRLMNKSSALSTDSVLGCALSLDTDTEHDVKCATGKFQWDNVDIISELTSVITKQIDNAATAPNNLWVEGDDNNGLPNGVNSGAVANWTTYYFFLIGKTDGTIDAGFDTSTTATNLLADASTYSYYKLLGAVWTDGSANIQQVINKQYVGQQREQYEFTANYTGGWTVPSFVSALSGVVVGGGGGGGAQTTNSGASGGDSVFGAFTAGGGNGGASGSTTGDGGEGGAPSASSADIVYFASAACGQPGNDDVGNTPYGGESGITAVSFGSNTVTDSGYFGFTGGNPFTDDAIRGGGGSGATTAGGGGGGAACVNFAGYPATGSITVTVGAGGTGGAAGGTAGYDGADGFIVVRF